MITSIIMPYRKENVARVIGGIRSQTVPSQIWSWDNIGGFNGQGEDVYFHCSKDFNHRPRFMLGGLVETEYIFVQDDDFELSDPTLFAQLIELSKKYPSHLLGVKGKKFDESADPEKPYQHNTCWCGEGEVDMVNTGLCFFRTEILTEIPSNPLINTFRTVTEKEYRFGDDMWLSSFGKCYATELFVHCVSKLDEQGVGLSHQSVHMDVRNELCRRYWL